MVNSWDDYKKNEYIESEFSKNEVYWHFLQRMEWSIQSHGRFVYRFFKSSPFRAGNFMDNNVSDFWQRLNIALASCNKNSLKEVCSTVGIAYQTLLNQKCQNRFPSVPVIAALAKELDCTIDWLLTGKEYKERMQNYYSAKIQSVIDILQQLN